METEVNNYLKDLLGTPNRYNFSPKEKRVAKNNKLQFIVSKLSRKRFRRRKLAAKTLEAITEKVQLSLKEDIPLHFVVPFGGYKHFWNPSHPEPDWAEIFNFKYLTNYVLPVLETHKPGVIFEYISEDLILERMNNYPPEALDKYASVFKEILDFYNKAAPKNLELRFLRVGEKYDKEKIIETVEKLLPERVRKFHLLSEKEKAKEIHRSDRSIMWDGHEDLRGLGAEEKQQRVIESRLRELTYYEVEGRPEFLGDYFWKDNHVCICFSFGTSHDNDEFQDLTLGSAHGSLVDHWIGRGVLNKQNGKFTPRIVSRDQYQKIKGALREVKVQKIFPFKNYKTIEVLVI